MLIQDEKKAELLKQMKGLALEIDLPLVTHNLSWAINSLVDIGRQTNDLDDKTNYFTQIEAISDCMRWAARIKDFSDQIEQAEDPQVIIEKGGQSC
jgi:hypothetical protein